VALLALVAAAWCRGGSAAEAVRPFETETWPVPATGVDERILASLREKGIEPARPCADEAFVRRVHLDILGMLPDPAALAEFLRDQRPDRRARLIDALLEREEYADYWTMKWCDLLRVKAEFPSNLWPNAVQAYQRWLRDAVARNRPYDQVARDLLTASGSNFRVAPVNFYRALQSRDPGGIAEAVALTLMGSRIAGWPAERRDGLAVFFSRVAYKGTDEWKEEIVYCNPAPSAPLDAVFPDGVSVTIPPGEDPRVVFADWLIRPENPWFARNLANRVWAWLLGRGLVHEPDDLRADNPPVQPELLDYLAEELVRSGYDPKHLFRRILNSRTYQQSPLASSDQPAAEALFACYPPRRLEAEVLADALIWVGGRAEAYESRIPEPFTWIPREQRTVALADGSITSTFLQMFGRPPRDTGLESERSRQTTDAQRLFMLNSTDVYRRLTGSIRLRRVASVAGTDRGALVRGVYEVLLSRQPLPGDLAAAEAYWETPGVSSDQAATDLAWALVNSMEFLYRH
jgi:hypothetical protein